MPGTVYLFYFYFIVVAACRRLISFISRAVSHENIFSVHAGVISVHKTCAYSLYAFGDHFLKIVFVISFAGATSNSALRCLL